MKTCSQWKVIKMNLSAPIYKLKRNAKLLSRNDGIPLHQALDRIARNEGFKSWSLLTKKSSDKHIVKSSKITSLPLSCDDRAGFIDAANKVFEAVLYRIEPENPEITRDLWNPEEYVDEFLTDSMLPISQDYAISLIEAFLVHHVIGLATQADKIAKAS